MKKQSILFILPGFNFGGTVFSTLNMISFLQRSGKYDIGVFAMTHQGPVKEYYKDIKVLPENFFLSALIANWAKERSILNKLKYFFIKVIGRTTSFLGFNLHAILYKQYAKKLESQYAIDFVVACQEGASTSFVSYFEQGKRIAWFRSEYSIYKKEITNSALAREQTTYAKFDNIVCVSQTTQKDFISYFPGISDRVLAIHNFQNVEAITKKSVEPVSDFPFSKFVIISIGRMNPQKRFNAIPSIARRLLDDGCEFKWIIIGDGNAFGEYDKLQEEIRKNNVNSEVVCLGARLNPYPYIQRANLLVNTSYVEACPRVVIEAKILKTPVICADFKSAREFVTSGVDGFVDSIENIHVPIRKLIQDKELYQRIKSACNKYEMDNEHIVSQLLDLFS